MANYDIYQFDYYCNIKNKLLNEIKRVCINRPVSELSLLMKYESDRFCMIAKDLIIINENIIPNNIIGIMFCREAVNNNSFIINLLKTNEKRPKRLARNMIDELVLKAKENEIKYIYIESNCSNIKKYPCGEKNIFYYDIDDDTTIMTGIILITSNMNTNNDVDIELLDNNIMFYLYKKNFFEYILTVKKYNEILGTVNFFVNKNINNYREIEINSMEGNIELLLVTLDNIATNNYIYRIYVKNTDYDDIFLENNYIKSKQLGIMYEKKTNTTQYIDRTVLSYYYNL